jgi:hypothetical protein
MAWGILKWLLFAGGPERGSVSRSNARDSKSLRFSSFAFRLARLLRAFLLTPKVFPNETESRWD